MVSFSILEASSSASNCGGYNYDVFLSFRGADTRNTFTGHLYANLVAHGIHTFRDDDELEKGGHIASNLSRAIEESKIFIIVFSKGFAVSKWCLKEVVKIIDCMKKRASVVLPVFYHVEPRDVRNQGGSFEKAFLEHAKDADREKEKKIETWKEALKTAGELKGYDVKNQIEAELIQKIREDIITRLNRKPLHMGDNIVGMDFHLEKLKPLIKELDEVHMVGIYGTGGIGKTTIAMAVYNDISSQFDGSSFLKNVGGKCEDDLLKLQKTLLQDILKGERPKFNNTSEGINVIKDRLRSKKVLIVLDDVDNYTQLENLAGKHGWYGAKSIIIITTRDRHLLVQHEVKALYEVQKLNHEKSIELFNWWAFKQNTATPKFEGLSDSVVKYAHGLPIALKVLGGFLFKKSLNEWNSEFHKLQKIPNKTVQSVLKVSYDKLDYREQSIFLDIACFFRGEDKDLVSRILGSDAEIGIKVLNDKCLITISENKLEMHDLLQQMGQEIVRQECLKEPEKWSRLWDPNDVDRVLTRNTGTQAIEGLFVHISMSNHIQFSTDSFTKMNRLRLLKVYYQRISFNEVHLPKDLEFPSSELRYLYFESYTLESLPTNFHAKNLVVFDLRYGSIRKLWKKNKILGNLKVINLIYLKDLVEIPDFSSMPNLEILTLQECTSLLSLPRNFHKLEHLQSLSCEGCSKLKSFPEIKGNMSKLREIDLRRTAIVEVPSSIGHLKALKLLDLSYCKNLVSLPESICNLSTLETLGVLECPKLERLEVQLTEFDNLITCYILKQGVIWSNDCFSSLKTLNLQGNQMEGEVLNRHIFRLSSLLELSIRNSYLMERGILSEDETLSASFHPSSLGVLSVGNFNPMARGILSDIFHQSSLKRLSLDNCNLMEEGIPTNIWNLPSLVHLSLSNCSLKEGDILNHICHLSSLEELSLDGNHFSSIPAGISRLSNLRGLNLSHCKKLQDIPKLPSSLLFLDAHCSDGISSSPSLLSSHSLFNRFKSKLIQETRISVGSSFFKGKGMSIVIPRSSGIVEGIRNQSMGSDGVKIELPQNWYQNNDLLGFAVCCVYVPLLDNESDSGYDLECWLTIGRNYPSNKFDDFWIHCWCHVCDDDHSVSDHVWVIYCPKDAIKEQYGSNQWTHFMVSFDDYVKVEECGIHLIYASCFKCQRPEECQQKFCLKGHDIHELPFIDRPFELDSLCLRECKNLESLPSTICELKSLTILSCSGCSQLKIFPEILEVLENLRELHLDGTAIEELPSSIQRIRGLRYLNLAYCNNLVSLPETIFHLKSLVFLSCLGCSQLKSFPEILENMENLRTLSLGRTAIKELPSSIEHLPGLQDLRLSTCNNLVNLPESICNLRFLRCLNVNFCSKLEKFPQNLKNLQCLEVLGVAGFDSNRVQGAIQSDVCYMSSGEASNRSINCFSSIPVNVILLSKLRILDLSHCPKLLQIPELPPSLRYLDVHACPCLETLSSPSSLLGFSLLRCFKSAIEEFECESNWRPKISIVIPGNKGIPEWISQQQRGSEITIELPKDWHQNNDFLGFALYSVYVPLDIESKEDPCSLKCELNFHGHRYESLDDLPSKFCPVGELWCTCRYSCCLNGRESNRVWVAYHPKVAIKKYWSNEWRHLKASFHGKQVKVEECGFHLIYMPNAHAQSSFGTNHWPRLWRENTGFNVKGSRDDAEDHLTEEPHPKRLRYL